MPSLVTPLAQSRRGIALALATTLLLGLTAVPTLAAPNERVGDRIDLRLGDQTFPASTPFYIEHGFGHEVRDSSIGLADFALDMDGQTLSADFVERGSLGGGGVTFYQVWIYSFPSGLTGSHEFTRHYFQACDDDEVPCNGNRINTPVEVFTVSAVVTFAP
jgi:hypothetical protein